MMREETLADLNPSPHTSGNHGTLQVSHNDVKQKKYVETLPHYWKIFYFSRVLTATTSNQKKKTFVTSFELYEPYYVMKQMEANSFFLFLFHLRIIVERLWRLNVLSFPLSYSKSILMVSKYKCDCTTTALIVSSWSSLWLYRVKAFVSRVYWANWLQRSIIYLWQYYNRWYSHFIIDYTAAPFLFLASLRGTRNVPRLFCPFFFFSIVNWR